MNPNETPQQIMERVRTDVIPPGELADLKLRLAAEYGLISAKLETILRIKPDAWMEIRQRPEMSSDKMADKLWDMTDLGKDEMTYKMQMKRIEKVISAIGTRLHAYETEVHNQF